MSLKMIFSRHRQKIAKMNILSESEEVQARGPGHLQLPPGHRQQATQLNDGHHLRPQHGPGVEVEEDLDQDRGGVREVHRPWSSDGSQL